MQQAADGDGQCERENRASDLCDAPVPCGIIPTEPARFVEFLAGWAGLDNSRHASVACTQTMLILPEPAARSSYRLSKSRYLSGLQCHKRLYLEVHAPGLATKPDAATQAILDMGTDLGNWHANVSPAAVWSRPGIVNLRKPWRKRLSCSRIRRFRRSSKGPFQFNQVLVRVDVLQRVGVNELGQPTWRLVEVKSSTKVKATHVDDLTIQSYVLEGLGLVLAESPDACEYAVRL